MKYGDQLEQESVPEWSLHNIDYNALKHEIKVHTTRDQAAAIAIPGHHDPALQKFEDRLYLELCRQHDRVDLFVSTKADEISRRLDSLVSHIKRLAAKYDRDGGSRVALKRHRKLSKYERDLLRCEEDILALSRFINAQVEAFRKIAKKYKKWTGSPTLGTRFRENVLASPKSFTRRDFSQLQNRFEESLATLRASTPQFSEPSSPSTVGPPSPMVPRRERTSRVTTPTSQPQIRYWNEYDYGSDGEAGGEGDGYAIYVDPDADDSFPGFSSMVAAVRRPLQRANSWFSHRRDAGDPSRRSLLPQTQDGAGPSYGGISPFGGGETDEDADYASSEENVPWSGYTGYYAALPSVNDQRIERYRERVLSWATLGAFATSLVLLLIASVLIATGRHKLRIEVDAGVTIGAAASLLCACLGLGMTIHRKDPLGVLYRAAVWTTFLASCVLNGMLLILVVGNAG